MRRFAIASAMALMALSAVAPTCAQVSPTCAPGIAHLKLRVHDDNHYSSPRRPIGRLW